VFSPVRWSVFDAWTAIGAGLEELQVAVVTSLASARPRDKRTCCDVQTFTQYRIGPLDADLRCTGTP